MQFSYTVLTNLRRTPLRERSEAGDRSAQHTLTLSDDLPRLYITTHLVLTLVRFAIVVVATVYIAEPIIYAERDGFFIEPGVGYLAVLLPIALLTYIVGELVPVAFGNAYADQAAPLVTSITRPIVFVLSPIVAILVRMSKTFAKLSGGEDVRKAVTEEEIMTLVNVGQRGGTIEDEEKEMIYSVLQFGETLAREVMVPRPDLTAIEIDEPLEEALRQFIESGHSRIPVYEEEIDNIKGLLYAKDLLALWHNGDQQATIRAIMRPAYFVPETKRADMLFKEMQERKIHLAVIVDEYGGTAGIVTIEDLVEEIVGDIKDEYDVNEEAEYIQLGEKEYIVDGSMNLDDLNEMMEIDLPTDEADSIGGYIYSLLGRVPDVGETIEEAEHHVSMRIEAVENRRIRKVHIICVEPPADDETSEAEAARQPDKRRADGNNRVTDAIETEAQPKPAQ
jgi:CBS domain containing-hemolysin-like protein